MLIDRTGPRWPASSWVIWLLVVVAPAPWLSAGSSMGPHVLLLLLLGAFLLRQGVRLASVGWVLAASALLLMHFSAALFLTPCQDSFGKSVASQMVVIPLIGALGLLASAHDGRPIDATLRQVLWVVVGSVILEKAFLVFNGKSEFLRPSGLFSEPSHLALSMAPVLASLIVSAQRRNQLFGWLGTLLLYVLSASATLFVLVAICLLFVTLGKPSARGGARTLLRVLAVATLSILLVAVSPYRDAFVERVLGLGDVSLSANMSSLIYLHGWESALGNFDQTSGFGLGINRMGCFPRPVTSATEILEFFDLGDSNYNDGSFTFSKLLSEFGVLAVVWQLGVLVFMFRAIGKVRAADPQTYTWHAFLLGCVAVMSLGAFIRGTGYFSGPFLIGLWAMFQLAREKPANASA